MFHFIISMYKRNSKDSNTDIRQSCDDIIVIVFRLVTPCSFVDRYVLEESIPPS